MSLSIDYNAVDIDNEVVVLDADTIAQTEADCRLGVSENGDTTYDINSPTCKEVLGEVIRKPATDPINPNGIDTINTYPINVAHSRQTGIQSSFDYRWDFTGYGNFAFSAGYYDALTHTTQQKAGDPTYNLLCCANSDELKSRFNASLTWNVGKWSSTLYGLRNGSSWNSVGTAKNIGPWVVFNGSVRYQLNKQASMLVSVNNIANKRPPIDSTNGNWPYYDTGIYNALGREVMAELHLDFGS
jgi:outer membrane receptor protein involved in Fe transport